MDDFKDLVWAVIDMRSGEAKTTHAFEDVRKALRLAGNMVGNMAYAGPLGDIYLFGRGDGNTEVMVRQLPRASVLAEDVFLTP